MPPCKECKLEFDEITYRTMRGKAYALKLCKQCLKEKTRKYQKRYRHTDKGKAALKKNNASVAGKARKDRYLKSLVGASKNRFALAKHSAESRGKEFVISFDEYTKEIVKPCFYCNDILVDESSHSGAKGTGIGLDRIDSSLGYVSGNIVRCCGTCNRIKGNNLTSEETKAAVDAIILLRKEKSTKYIV